MSLPKEIPENDRLGVPADRHSPDLQSELYKEAINKLAWAVGSTWGVPYRNPRTGARELAINLATYLFATQGYPARNIEP
ncbi:MAG TPA: hypothetical protein EYO33_22315 [Phycisphaerales bacterium]|nr:hypothetical protein [Phycisphaerales bacterium]